MPNNVKITPASGSLNFEYTLGEITDNIELKYGSNGKLGIYKDGILLMSIDGNTSTFTSPSIDTNSINLGGTILNPDSLVDKSTAIAYAIALG